jgi:flavodoxin
MKAPFFISARLLPAIKVDGVTISLQRGIPDPASGYREKTKLYFDLPDGTEIIDDTLNVLRNTPTQDVFGTLFAFLGCGEQAYSDTDEGTAMFDKRLHDWIRDNKEEFSLLKIDLEEGPQLIED